MENRKLENSILIMAGDLWGDLSRGMSHSPFALKIKRENESPNECTMRRIQIS